MLRTSFPRSPIASHLLKSKQRSFELQEGIRLVSESARDRIYAISPTVSLDKDIQRQNVGDEGDKKTPSLCQCPKLSRSM